MNDEDRIESLYRILDTKDRDLDMLSDENAELLEALQEARDYFAWPKEMAERFDNLLNSAK